MIKNFKTMFYTMLIHVNSKSVPLVSIWEGLLSHLSRFCYRIPEVSMKKSTRPLLKIKTHQALRSEGHCLGRDTQWAKDVPLPQHHITSPRQTTSTVDWGKVWRNATKPHFQILLSQKVYWVNSFVRVHLKKRFFCFKNPGLFNLFTFQTSRVRPKEMRV